MGDPGRGVSADLVASSPGMECWGGTIGLRSATGAYVGETPSSSNFLVWWDGDDLRELLDDATVSKYGTGTIFSATNCISNNGTKSTPGLSADLLGDWREEIIFRTVDNNSLRIYASTIPTNRRLYTLMHDPQYRLSIAWQNVAYNQPPHTGFFIGNDMAPPPPPPIVSAKLRWSSGTTWDLTSPNWLQAGTLTAFQDGDDVLFDLSGSNGQAISLAAELSPSKVSVYAPKDYIFDGPGSLTGTMGLLKAGTGTLTLNSDHDFSGETAVWQGNLMVNGSLQQSSAVVYKGAGAGGRGTFGRGLTLHQQGILVVGPGRGSPGTLRINDQLVAEGEAVICFDLSADSSGVAGSNDLLIVGGDLVLSGTNTFDIQLLDGSLQVGQYTLIRYSGTLSGDIGALSCTGLEGIPYRLIDTGDAIKLEIIKLRDPARIIWRGGTPNDWDMAGRLNWLNAGIPDWFVPNDTVIFDDTGAPNTTVNLVGSLYIGRMVVDASSDYTLGGSGVISGPGGVEKRGEATVRLSGEHEYTGPTRIDSGTLEIPGLKNGGQSSAVGASSGDPSNLVLNGGTLRLTGTSSSSNRGMTVGAKGGTINLAGTSSHLALSGNITGEGLLTKTGNGNLTLSAANSWSGGMLIRDGVVNLGSEEANIGGLGSGKVTLQNATLNMLDDRNSYTDGCDWDLVVPEGSESWLNLDSRGSLVGSLEGSGILHIGTPFIRSELSGDWSAFAGRIRVGTDADDATFLPGSAHGFENAAIDLSDRVAMLYMKSENVTIKIGELSGSAGSELGSGGEGSNTVTWVIGGRNTNAVFHGVISDRQFKNTGSVASVIKTGTGNWTLTNANTYSGTTEIQGGILTIENSSGSATGSGHVVIRSGGALRGNGTTAGRLLAENQASVSVGTGNQAGVLTVDNDAEFLPGSYLSVKLNPVDKSSDKLVVNGHLKLGGILYVSKSAEGGFSAGETYRILEADSTSGVFEMILPSSPGEGLEWDTTWLASDGLLHIVPEPGTGVEEHEALQGLSIFPNPGSGIITVALYTGSAGAGQGLLRCYDQQGRQVHQERVAISGARPGTPVDTREWAPGIYLFVVNTGRETLIQQFVKQ
jgi:fibronectin-binding autotransporter adhesin